MPKTEVMHPETTIGGRIQKMRHKAQLSRSALYDLVFPYGEAGSDANKETTVRNWEAGKYELDYQNLAAVCRALNCSSDYLLGLDECTNKKTQFIHDQTGLSEDAINKLLSFKGKDDRVLSLDFLLLSEEFTETVLPCLYFRAFFEFTLIYAACMAAIDEKESPALRSLAASLNESTDFYDALAHDCMTQSDIHELNLNKGFVHITDDIIAAAMKKAAVSMDSSTGSGTFESSVKSFKEIQGGRTFLDDGA